MTEPVGTEPVAPPTHSPGSRQTGTGGGLLATPRGRRALFAALYFLEGAPIGFLWWVLPTALRARGYAVDESAALLGALALPWGLKFLWAPLVDALRGPRFTERGWILAAQAVMALALAPLVANGLELAPALLAALLLVHATAAATQDVAIDCLAVRSTAPEERGAINAWMNAGMLSGRALFGAGALALRGELGDRSIAGALVLLLAGGATLSLAYRPACLVEPLAARGRARLAELFGHARRVAGRRRTWRLVAFAATGGAGFEVVGGLLSPFVLDLGASEGQLAAFYALPAWAAPIAGGFLGGWFSDRCARRGRPRAGLVGVGLGLGALVLVLAGATVAGDLRPPLLFALLAGVYLALGAFTAASYALFMDETDPALGATQFSAYMGATNLCESWSVALGGRLAARTAAGSGAGVERGYGLAFGLLALVSLAALLWLPKDEPTEAASS